MAEGCDDQMLTNSQLARRFKEYVENIPVNDFVIAPFSEVTRFYENEKYAEFDSLLKTIRLIEASEDAQQNHQRIYVPIIGMQSKMGKFKNDPIFIYGNIIQTTTVILISSFCQEGQRMVYMD